MAWTPPFQPNNPNQMLLSLDAALSSYATAIEPTVNATFLQFIWLSYQLLHTAIRRAVNSNFQSLNPTNEMYYHNSFTYTKWSQRPLLNGLRNILSQGGSAFAGLAERYAVLLAQTATNVNVIAIDPDLPSDAETFFQGDLFDEAREACDAFAAATSGVLADAIPIGSGLIDPLQQVALYLLAIPLGLQAIYGAVSARDLYEIDGNAGVRAAAVKIGGTISSQTNVAAPSLNLMGLGAIGSLEAYVGALWSVLGGVLPDPQPEVNISEDGTTADVLGFSALLVGFETGTQAVSLEMQRGFSPDQLCLWGAPKSAVELAVSQHLQSIGSNVVFDPTWLALPNDSTAVGYFVGANSNVLYAHPLAQLCAYVATRLLALSSAYVTPSPAPGESAAGGSGYSLPPVSITAACLEFGGRHPPHKTHRSGYEMDISIHDGLVRALNNVPPPSHAYDQVANAILELDFTAQPSILTPDLFGDQFDWYGNDPKRDTPAAVATARSLQLSLYLSGCSRVIFNDPWLFVDVYQFLGSGFQLWKNAIHAIQTMNVPKQFGYNTNYLVAPIANGIAFALGHYNHWHCEWAIPHAVNNGPISLAPNFLLSWLPIWISLGIQKNELVDVLDDLLSRNMPAQTSNTGSQSNSPQWSVDIEDMKTVINGYASNPLLPMYPYLYGGQGAVGGKWLTENIHPPVVDRTPPLRAVSI